MMISNTVQMTQGRAPVFGLPTRLRAPGAGAFGGLRQALAGGLMAAALLALPLAAVAASDPVDLGSAVPDIKSINEGLFPEDACEELKQAGFKCMGFRPAVRFSLPAATFKVGSADLPDLLRQQLDRFAEVFKGKRGASRVVRIEGHADATGAEDLNQTLSQRRAEAVRDYLVKNGVEQGMLAPVGLGARMPKSSKDPFAPENRRVEIGRQTPPTSP